MQHLRPIPVSLTDTAVEPRQALFVVAGHGADLEAYTAISDVLKVTRARVLTFHVGSHQLLQMSEALDAVSERCARHPDFEGLVCLQHDSVLHQLIVITLWGGHGLEDTQADSEMTQQQIATTTDLGVSNISYEVVRLVPGSAAHDGAWLAPALVS